jgi:hypothetical protein
MEYRIAKFVQIYEELPEQHNMCISKSGFLKHVTISHRIGSGLFGDVYTGTIRNKQNPIQKQTNITKLKLFQQKKDTVPDFIIKTCYSSISHLAEANLAEDVSNIVYNNKCPHFPLSYGYYLCGRVKFKGLRGTGVFKEAGPWQRIKMGKGLIQLAEYAGMSFYDFLSQNPDTNELHACIAQVLIAIYTLRKYTKINHGDLYFNNITMYPVSKPVCFRYKINKTEYNIPVKRWYPVLIDYGQAEDIKNIEGSGDIFTFLTEFSVGYDGSRPKVSKKGVPIISLTGIPENVSKTVVSMLKKILFHYQDVEKNSPYPEWLVKKYQTGTMLLKETFAHVYKERKSNCKTFTFKI